MNVKYLESFLEVAKDLNMTTAAQRLYISQQTLSFQIQRLELYYGVKLFERQPKLQLTYAGKQLVEGAGVIIKENESLINSFSDISSKHSGLLRIAIPAYRAAECFPMVLPDFHKRWPNISLELVEESSEEMLQMLCDGALDLLIGTPSRSEVSGLKDRIDFTLLLEEKSYIICSDILLEHYFGKDTPRIKEQAACGTDLHEFSQVPFILHKPPMRLRRVADECFHNAGFKPNVYIESSNTELMISLYPCHLGAFFCRKSRLPSLMKTLSGCNAFPIKNDSTLLQTPICLMRRKNGKPPGHVNDFMILMKTAWKHLADFPVSPVSGAE